MSDGERSFGKLHSWARVGVAWVAFGCTALVFCVVALFLLPWRGVRLSLASKYAKWIAPICLRICAIDLTVDHLERSTEGPPCIFTLNHASALDAFLVMAAFPPRGCGVGKKEVLWLPFFGQAYWLAGMILIDRATPERARAAVNQLSTVVHGLGLSPVIAPEGTRSSDGTLGPFKKGVVHMAVATRLPIRPYVIHHAWRRMPAREFRITPGPLRCEVLEDIPTDDWSLETMDAHLATIRAAYEGALEPLP